MQQPVSKWANTEPDAGLPHALLERLAQRLPVGIIEEVWLFPTRRTSVGESTVFLVAAVEPEPEKRRVITARYTVTRDRRGAATVQEQIDEHGTAPAAAVTRIVNGVLHRMDEEGEQPPRAERIERDQERWWTLLESLGGTRPQATEPTAEQHADSAPAASDVAPVGGPAPAAEQDAGSAPAASDVARNEAPEHGADVPRTDPPAPPSVGGGAIDGANGIGYQ